MAKKKVSRSKKSSKHEDECCMNCCSCCDCGHCKGRARKCGCECC